MFVTKILLLCVVVAESLAQQVVNTPDGPIKGTQQVTTNGKQYYSYFTIRYGKPPTGSRRFLEAEPVDPWTEVYDASSQLPNICYQLYDDSEAENEDCLFLSVYTPQAPSSSGSLLPVFVNIHGGGFVSGSGGFSAEYLIDYDVVVVSFNYRLGVFGFLSTGDDVIPGNTGLKDQIMALKWVQRNIAAFGGDPNQVTISGTSAGAASVGYLVLSPAANGLFRGAIQESGSPLVPWAYQRNHTQIAFKTGSFIDSQFENIKDSKKLLDVLQNADARAIDSAALTYANWDSGQPAAAARLQLQQGFYFAPVIEVPNNNAVLTQYQYEAFLNGDINKVPLLLGICSEEGLMSLDQYLNYTLQAYDMDSSYLYPQDLHATDYNEVKTVGALIKQEYSPSQTFLENQLGGIQYFTEQGFAKSMVKQAELQSVYTDVYFYEFSYTGQMSLNTKKLPGSGNVTHVEEYNYLYGYVDPKLYPENDQLVHSRLLKLWTNFVKYQNPTPTQEDLLQNITWPKVQQDDFQFVNIGNYEVPDMEIVNEKPKAKRIAFWENLYANYGHRPYDTY